MSAESQNETPASEPVRVTLDLPGRIVRDFTTLATVGVYLSLEDGLRQAVINSWRHEFGSFHRIRIDLDSSDDEVAANAAEEPEASVEE